MLRLLTLVTTFFLVACSSYPNKPQEVVEQFLNAVKAGDFEKASNYVGESERKMLKTPTNPDQTNLIKKIFNKINYKIIDTKVENAQESVYEVTVNVTAAKVMTMLQRKIQDLSGEISEEISNMVDQGLEEGDKSDIQSSQTNNFQKFQSIFQDKQQQLIKEFENIAENDSKFRSSSDYIFKVGKENGKLVVNTATSTLLKILW